jgi:sugar phosphate isomerase/epimerase
VAVGVAQEKRRFDFACFIKPFGTLPYDRIADIIAEVGWTGVEVAVREKETTINPERVEEELPKFQETLAKRHVEISVLATDVEDASAPPTQRLLRTASKLGIRRYRIKHLLYDLKKPIAPQLANLRAKLRDLAQLNQELNLIGSIQNHSGANNLGAPVWDLWELIHDLDPRFMGIQFDIGHATLEGGTSWPLQARLMEPFFTTISVKDFYWRQPAEKGGVWKDAWCPLGEGLVRPAFFDFLKTTAFHGPVSQHFEYPLGTGDEMIAALKKDFTTLKRWLEA